MPNIYTTITVDWDGLNLDDVNIKAMETFNKTFPGIPITHFICPVYLTRLTKPQDRIATAAKINRVIKDIDEVGLHIHCWYSLMLTCGSSFYTKPTWYQNDDPGARIKVPPGLGLPDDQDCGHAVPFGIYPVEKIKKILAQGRQLLINAGIKNTTNASAFQSFRSGGWLSCDNVLTAVQQAGFPYEASAVPSGYFDKILAPVYPATPAFRWISAMWSGMRTYRPVYLVNTISMQAYSDGVSGMYPIDPTTTISGPARMQNLTQIPDTGALSDYTSHAALQTYIDAAAKQVVNTKKDVFISMGWHEDSATWTNSDFHPGVANIQVIMNILNANPGRLAFYTVEKAAKLWQASQLSIPVFPREEELVRLKHPVTLPHIPVTKIGVIHG